jgi:hypothetical protein
MGGVKEKNGEYSVKQFVGKKTIVWISKEFYLK